MATFLAGRPINPGHFRGSNLRSGRPCSLAVQAAGAQKPFGENPIGVHALVWAGDWSRPSAELAITKSAKLGYDIVEIPLLDPSRVDAKMTREVLAAHGMTATTSLGLNFEADISSANGEVAKAGEALLEDALAATAAMGSEYMVGVIYSALGKYPGPPTPQGNKNCADALRRLAAKAADQGITLGLEVVNRYETNVLNTAAQGMEMLGEVGAENVVVHLDTYHMHIEEAGLAQAVEVCGDKLGYVHIGESNRGYLGSGNLDFEQFFRALATADYGGPITFESFSSEVVDPNLSNVLCVWRNLWEDSEDLAGEAKGFMDASIAAAAKS